jgi:hypothetical protein
MEKFPSYSRLEFSKLIHVEFEESVYHQGISLDIIWPTFSGEVVKGKVIIKVDEPTEFKTLKVEYFGRESSMHEERDTQGRITAITSRFPYYQGTLRTYFSNSTR